MASSSSSAAAALLTAALALAACLPCSDGAASTSPTAAVRLPDGFMIGAGTSAYQIEGGWNADGKGVSTLDRAYGNRSDGGGNVAADHYHRYREDVAMLKLMGATHYRFSLAWARLLPTGEASSLSDAGVRFYTALLDELEANGIAPVVTLYHMDIPAALSDRFGGWLSPKMADYFETYAVTAFRLFGDRVKLWVTLNEPYMFCVFGVGHGRLGAAQVRPGDGEYLCAHHMLLGHAKAYRAYHRDFAHQGGQVGMSLQNFFTRPFSSAAADSEAAETHQMFELGLFLEPVLRGGEYPAVVRRLVDANSAREGRPRSRLPAFTAEEKRLLAGTLDFLGLNVYFGWSARHGVPDGAADPSIERDGAFIINGTANQFLPPGPFRSTPWAVRTTLGWVRDRYGPMTIVLTENGFGDDGAEGLEDRSRVEYLQVHLAEASRAIYEDGHNITGYFVWSLLDNFEWGAGYTTKFGLVHVDYASGSLTRTPKASLHFMRGLIEAQRRSASTAGSAAAAVSGGAAVLAAALVTAAALGVRDGDGL